ncbi:hypothetical protein HY251_07100 [bacterium]|nr:hypothetical protein [bacterium]
MSGIPPYGSITENEVYDTATTTWTLVSALTAGDAGYMTNVHPIVGTPVHTSRTRHSALQLTSAAGGKILVLGGLGIQDNPPFPSNPLLTTCFVFDPSGNSFTQVDDMPKGRSEMNCVTLSTGLVLVCAGLVPPPPPPPISPFWGVTTKTAWLYDYTKSPGTQWIPIGGPAPGGFLVDSTDYHWGGVIFQSGPGKASIAGGAAVGLTTPSPPFPYSPLSYYFLPSAPFFPTAKCETYDSGTGGFGAGPTYTVDRFLAMGTAMKNGDALIGGGLVSSIPSAVLKTIDYFDHTTSPPAFAAVPNSFVFPDPDVDPSASPPLVPTISTKSLHTERYWGTAGEVDGGRSGDVLFSGGFAASGGIYLDACLWQMKIHGMNNSPDTPSPPCEMLMSDARVHHANAPLFDGRLMLIGGFNGATVVASTDIYGH